jgi:hypothetical protein
LVGAVPTFHLLQNTAANPFADPTSVPLIETSAKALVLLKALVAVDAYRVDEVIVKDPVLVLFSAGAAPEEVLAETVQPDSETNPVEALLIIVLVPVAVSVLLLTEILPPEGLETTPLDPAVEVRVLPEITILPVDAFTIVEDEPLNPSEFNIQFDKVIVAVELLLM